MELITLGDNQEEVLEKVKDAIRDGKIVAVPTDTVYGFIADATNNNAVKHMYALKQRPNEKAFPVFVRNIAMARWFAYISDTKMRFLEKIWPGSVTVIFHHKEKLPECVTADHDTIAMRMPQSPLLLSLLDQINVPLVQSSANISGVAPATSAQAIVTSFEYQRQKPDLIIDGGEVLGKPSTIINFTGNNPRMVRSGLVSKEEIDSLFVRLRETFEQVGKD